MKCLSVILIASLVLVSLMRPLHATETDGTVSASSSSTQPLVVNDIYPGLTTGALVYAKAADLPEGTLLRAPTLVINNKELTEDIAKAPQNMQPQLKKFALFHLEQIATFKLLLAEARTQAAKTKNDISEKSEREIIQNHLRTLAETADVNDAEIRDFYHSNAEILGGATLAQVKPQIEQFLLQQKQQELVKKHIRTIGRRINIEISASWLKKQAASAMDNPVDKARASGRVSLVDFGSEGCIPCDMMAPILETLGQKYKDNLNVLFINVRNEPILAGRYGIESIPVQIFFDKTGKEVFRHVGFFAQEEIEKRLSQMGVK
jgi:thiol-disulfide isomerase/thioredoxin